MKTYNTGKPCKNGHTGDRYTSTGGCIECQLAHSANQAKRRHLAKSDMVEVRYALHVDDVSAIDAYVAAVALQRVMSG